VLRRLLGASVAAAILAVTAGVVVSFLVSTDSHITRRTNLPSPSRPQRQSTPTPAKLAKQAAPRPRSGLPSEADYGAVVSARVVIHQALREPNWHGKSYGALLGMKALMTIHPIASARCAWFVNRTYDELRDLLDAYPGENWAPMVTVVHHDPPVTICRAPSAHRSKRDRGTA
jgi:hypothetical protein